MSENAQTPQGQYLFFTPDGDVYGEDTPESRELARRIQACINACADLSTQELESGIVRDMHKVIAEVVPLLERKNELETAAIKAENSAA